MTFFWFLGKGALYLIGAVLAILVFLMVLVLLITLVNKVLQFIGNMVGWNVGNFWEWVNNHSKKK